MYSSLAREVTLSFLQIRELRAFNVTWPIQWERWDSNPGLIPGLTLLESQHSLLVEEDPKGRLYLKESNI